MPGCPLPALRVASTASMRRVLMEAKSSWSKGFDMKTPKKGYGPILSEKKGKAFKGNEDRSMRFEVGIVGICAVPHKVVKVAES
jgi:hypothetical protein